MGLAYPSAEEATKPLKVRIEDLWGGLAPTSVTVALAKARPSPRILYGCWLLESFYITRGLQRDFGYLDRPFLTPALRDRQS